MHIPQQQQPLPLPLLQPKAYLACARIGGRTQMRASLRPGLRTTHRIPRRWRLTGSLAATFVFAAASTRRTRRTRRALQLFGAFNEYSSSIEDTWLQIFIDGAWAWMFMQAECAAGSAAQPKGRLCTHPPATVARCGHAVQPRERHGKRGNARDGMAWHGTAWRGMTW